MSILLQKYDYNSIYKRLIIQKFKTHERVMSVAAVYAVVVVVEIEPADSAVVVVAVVRRAVARVDAVDFVVAAVVVVAPEPIVDVPAAAP